MDVPISCFEEISALYIYTKVCPNYFLLKKYLHSYIRQNGSRKIFVRCSANVLRPNTGGGKQTPASTVTTWSDAKMRLQEEALSHRAISDAVKDLQQNGRLTVQGIDVRVSKQDMVQVDNLLHKCVDALVQHLNNHFLKQPSSLLPPNSVRPSPAAFT